MSEGSLIYKNYNGFQGLIHIKMYKILIVEDEWNMRNLIKIYLSARDEYEIHETSDGLKALEEVQENHFDLLILDIMLPELDGWEVCRQIREFSNIPILILTARTDVKDRVKGLHLGADDYLIKPFAPEELSARIAALLRRTDKSFQEHHREKVIMKDLIIYLDSREVKVRGRPVELTPKEYDLLLLLVENPKNVFTRDHLLNVIWKTGDERDLRTVDTHVKNVREKLKKALLSFNPVKTVWGIGYRFGEMDE